jgi:hypothetical protein
MNVNMEERLGSKIKKHRTKIPFEGMTKEQRCSIESLVCRSDEEEDEKMILLLECKVDKSIFPGKDNRGALRFRLTNGIIHKEDGTVEHLWSDDEHWAWTGSEVMIGQMQSDFTTDDLPAPTAIHEFVNKYGKRYYKFT